MQVCIDPDGLERSAIHALVDFRNKRVLEIGAGDGRMTWRFADRASEVLAIDPLEGDVLRALDATPQHLRARVRFVAADATTYAYPKNHFDVVVLSHSLC